MSLYFLSLSWFRCLWRIRKKIESTQAAILRDSGSLQHVADSIQQGLELQKAMDAQQLAVLQQQSTGYTNTSEKMEQLVQQLQRSWRVAEQVQPYHVGLSELEKWLIVNKTRQTFAQLYEETRLRLFADVRRLQESTDCSNAKYLACYTLHRTCGFGCQVHTIADCMTSALLTNRTAVLLPSQLYRYGPECSSQWHCFFLPLASCQRHAATVNDTLWHPWTSGGTHPYAVYNAWGEDENRVPPYLSVLDDTMFDAADPKPSAACLLTGVLMSWLLRPNERVAAAIAHRRHSLGLEGAPFHVGVHVRRSDKRYEATTFGLQHYMMQVDQFVGPGDYYHASYGRRYGKRLLIVSGVLWGVPPSNGVQCLWLVIGSRPCVGCKWVMPRHAAVSPLRSEKCGESAIPL